MAGSAATLATLDAASMVDASGVNQSGWRGSITVAPDVRFRQFARKRSTSAGSNFRLGGSWISSGPSFSPKAEHSSRNRDGGSLMSISLRSWVIVLGIFTANRKSGGVLEAQRS